MSDKPLKVTDFGMLCQICFDPLVAERCAMDVEGRKWNVCDSGCAIEAGIPLARQLVTVFRAAR